MPFSSVDADNLVGEQFWNDWRWQIAHRLTRLEDIEKWLVLTEEEKLAIIDAQNRMRMAITPYFVSLMDKTDPDCPIRKQALPSLKEFRATKTDLIDPCGEEQDMVIPGLVHRYPDRVLLIATNACAVYCRHCTRRRLVGCNESHLSEQHWSASLEYIRKNKKIRDVLVSGGDPLLINENRLEKMLSDLRAIEHIEIIRIGTRLPVTLPQRITPELCAILKKFHPLYLSIHFNHPKEITEESRRACQLLADAGIPLGSQTVLLKGINDSPKIITTLMQELLKIRVKPYYLYQCDLAPGTAHFRTPISCGLKIIRSLRGFTSGYALPTFVIDAPGGGGKVPITPDYVISKTKKGIIFYNYQSKIYIYPEGNYGEQLLLEKEELETKVST